MTSLPEFDDEKPVGLLDFIGNKPPGLLGHFRALSQRRPPGLLEHFRALSQSPFSLGMPPSDFPTPLTSLISGLMSWPPRQAPDSWNRNKSSPADAINVFGRIGTTRLERSYLQPPTLGAGEDAPQNKLAEALAGHGSSAPIDDVPRLPSVELSVWPNIQRHAADEFPPVDWANAAYKREVANALGQSFTPQEGIDSPFEQAIEPSGLRDLMPFVRQYLRAPMLEPTNPFASLDRTSMGAVRAATDTRSVENPFWPRKQSAWDMPWSEQRDLKFWSPSGEQTFEGRETGPFDSGRSLYGYDFIDPIIPAAGRGGRRGRGGSEPGGPPLPFEGGLPESRRPRTPSPSFKEIHDYLVQHLPQLREHERNQPFGIGTPPQVRLRTVLFCDLCLGNHCNRLMRRRSFMRIEWSIA